MDDSYALLWSRKQNGFHVERLADSCRSGMRFFQQNASNDYLLIAIGTRDEVGEIADEHRPILIERDEVRKLYDTGD